METLKNLYSPYHEAQKRRKAAIKAARTRKRNQQKTPDCIREFDACLDRLNNLLGEK